ncbi:phenylacetate-CoA oxygenase subunit PaaJ [Actinomadura viridis]|uniref:Ring-1,2-phenylacetyl-CoA epoxidase subunit PaaD n=1 Tax=Actinomadura viridis TaxID=58110 RepID=A0A931DSP0_9ACTN|nr:1,2-phenylacetyl-CoA epoxidase subunit PaaD [Actinomadura viridis]MBG6093131.1 ring-1,2-phenylacetyl-CoA epoxidase subunit PaaD [Actinomadura viridis]
MSTREGARALSRARERAAEAAARVRDPEMPMLTLADLGVLRAVEIERDARGDETVIVSITPTYTGCPAMATMRDDLVHRLNDAGFPRVEVRVVLSPPWSTDWISERGRAALREAGLSAPGPAPRPAGPVPLTLGPARPAPPCPRCGSAATRLTSEFGATACKALYRCTGCLEPFEHVKEI